MWVSLEAHSLIFASSAASTVFSIAVSTSSSCFTAAAQFAASKLLNVSSLLPLIFRRWLAFHLRQLLLIPENEMDG